MPKFYSFATYADMRQEWVIKADSLEEAKQKIGNHPDGDWLIEAEMVDTDFVGGGREFYPDKDNPPMVEEVAPNLHSSVFFAPFEKQELETERRKRLPADSVITSDLTRFNRFEIAAVKMFRNWESEEPSFTCQPCPNDGSVEATFWTVYGHYDAKLPENLGFGGVDALIDCWALHDAERLVKMLDVFREQQLQLKAGE